MRRISIFLESEQNLLSDQIELANRFFTRLRGLLGREGLAPGQGLMLSPCGAVHCHGMKFTIDVIFLDKGYKILRIVSALMPGGKASQKGARHVLELAEGQAGAWGLEEGQKIIVK